MARYIDADKLCKDLTDMARYQDPYKQSTILGVVGTIENTRTADVVPRSEVARIFEELENLIDPYTDEYGTMLTLEEEEFAELKKKYTEGEK